MAFGKLPLTNPEKSMLYFSLYLSTPSGYQATSHISETLVEIQKCGNANVISPSLARKGMNMDSKERFSDRVESYVKYRPSYPNEAIDFIIETGMKEGNAICDVGSGTGILTELLLKRGVSVYGVEPNDEMRKYAENHLKKYPAFSSIFGSAEATNIEDNFLDAITVAQAFHWFDRDQCRHEFKRILKNKGFIFLIWNKRDNSSAFMQEYDMLLKEHGTDYRSVSHHNLTKDDFLSFFQGHYETNIFKNYQELDRNGLLGRALSASYTPNINHPRYPNFQNALNCLFKKYNESGIIRMKYYTEIIWGELKS